jgi:hypothetical protein
VVFIKDLVGVCDVVVFGRVDSPWDLSKPVEVVSCDTIISYVPKAEQWLT